MRLIPPAGARFDGGVVEGGAVGTAFDPMIGKLVVHGSDRGEALANADRALRDLVLLGVRTNIAYLRRLIADPDVAAGDMHTGLIGEKPALAADPPLAPATIERLVGIAAPHVPELVAEAAAMPALHAAIGRWTN